MTIYRAGVKTRTDRQTGTEVWERTRLNKKIIKDPPGSCKCIQSHSFGIFRSGNIVHSQKCNVLCLLVLKAKRFICRIHVTKWVGTI